MTEGMTQVQSFLKSMRDRLLTRGGKFVAKSRAKLDLRAKISLVILGVLVPTFLILTLAIHQFIQPTLLREIEQMGITAARTLASEIVAQRWLTRENANRTIESKLREFLYLQPNVKRVEVFAKNPETGVIELIASTIEEDPSETPQVPLLTERVHTKLHDELEAEENGWEILAPIKSGSAKEARTIGTVRIYVSIQIVNRLSEILSQVNLLGGLLGMILMFVLLNTALHRTIENDRKLTEAEKQNLVLSQQLHETERRLMNSEKLAVLGQLTASFAHEIGTPLNAIGGHLSLLRDEVAEPARPRLSIIEGQVKKITDIVRGFLQSTAKPASQRQLVDPHAVIDKTLGIVRPRTEALSVSVEKDFNRDLGPIRMVPLELEQVLLNLVNNSLDSLRAKQERAKSPQGEIRLSTRSLRRSGKEFLVISVHDSGEGIAAKDLSKVVKPFYTTKAPGEGTGLGLTICQDLARKYGGDLIVDSEVGKWTEVRVEIPYHGADSSRTHVPGGIHV